MEMSKSILVLVVTLVWCLSGINYVHGFTYDDKEVETEEGKSAMFERWRSHHKMESISAKDKKKQYDTFKATLEHVHNTNKANKGFKLEMNHLAGMTTQEIKSKYTGVKAPPKFKGLKADPSVPKRSRATWDEWSQQFLYRNFTDVPPSIDWRARGAVTPAKNQASCGSCYAFGATDSVEGLHAIRTGQLIELSPQEIVDCANIGGCDGGRVDMCFTYVKNNGGLTTMKNYPYVAKVETCNVKKEHDIAVPIGGFQQAPYGYEDDVLSAVAHQPVVFNIQTNDDFCSYKEGILDSPCGTAIDHSVVAVGYDTAPDGTKYWIIKNSWSANWGDKGFAKMLRNAPNTEGYCGLALFAAFPTETDTGFRIGDHDPIVHSAQEL